MTSSSLQPDENHDTPRGDLHLEAKSGGEALVQLLVAQGVEHIFLNPGTDTAPLQEAVVALRERGHAVPRIHLCPDERVALSAAQTYWQRRGRPQAVIVHVDVGTQGLAAALHNAQRTNSGVVIIAGKAPRTFDGERSGGRTISVHWQQDQADPIGIVRGFVKWAEEITMTESFASLVPRAFQVSRSGPAGPVYLLVAREILMEPMDGIRIIPPERMRAPAQPAAAPLAIETAARWVAEAVSPVIVTGRLGRINETVACLETLAELVGIPVTDAREYLNLASDHPCYVESLTVGADHVRNADVVLVIDAEVPWVPAAVQPDISARVIQVDMDPVKASMVNWSFRIDLPIQADSALAIPQLINELIEVHQADRASAWTERLERLTQAARSREARREREVQSARSSSPISAIAVTAALDELITDETLVLEEVTTNDLYVKEYLSRKLPGSVLAIGAAGLGWAPGGAIGAKLAEPDREVVVLVGDGSFGFSAPLAWLWTANAARTPFMTVIYNNGGYRAAKNPVVGLFPDGASVRLNDFSGTVFEDGPDYAAVAEACGAYGESVSSVNDLAAALERGLGAVGHGRCAVINVDITPM